MTALVWDEVGTRFFETGVDRGVLYLTNNNGVPWNGLTSVSQKATNKSSPNYFDGMKVNDVLELGDFEGTLSAITYPDEFLEFEGVSAIAAGVYLGEQPPKVFGLCYRTKIGNDIDGIELGYKLHILYNVSATPSDKQYDSIGDELSPMEFQWDITATPEEVPGFRPTAHFIIDSRTTNPTLLENLEEILYGNDILPPLLPPIEDLVEYVTTDWVSITIVDNGDGSYTIITQDDDDLVLDGVGGFTLYNATVEILSPTRYKLSNTP